MTLTLHVDGARYEPFPFSFHGRAAHRMAPSTGERRVTVSLPGDGAPFSLGTRSSSSRCASRWVCTRGPRPMDSGLSPATLWNRTPANRPQLSERVLFSARLTAVMPAAQLANSETDHDMTQEAASLRLLYADAPVRAVGHGVDAAVTTCGDLALVRTESLPVAEVNGTTPDVGDAAGSLAVDMDALGRWDLDAVATVERMITSYREWIRNLAQPQRS
ncbi:hypothetical protein MSM1_20020 [Mycobacterium sp. SM1]|uniref:hypothetical protein n=1 Tax=Mycobacterium sp. SM1 TaxID=2816243 RepID=UPI001BCBA2CE|nr:hypothetical protein [Mycobacterium sp. SM1]MBS4730510.1 hypothetical protein [Mycobacterium sp. SM1]